MSSTTVAPIEGYVFQSELSAPDNYAQINAQEQVSFQLTDSDLWLVDISKLRSETLIEPFPFIADNQIQQIKYQINVPFANISDNAEPITLPKAFSSLPAEWSGLSLQTDTALQLAAFRGDVDLSSFSGTFSPDQKNVNLSQSGTQSFFAADSKTGTQIGSLEIGKLPSPPQGSTSPPTPVPLDFTPSIGIVVFVTFWAFNSFLRGKIFYPSSWVKLRNFN